MGGAMGSDGDSLHVSVSDGDSLHVSGFLEVSDANFLTVAR